MLGELSLRGKLDNPLLSGVAQVRDRVASFKESAKHWYFQVVLSPYSCPQCKTGLQMIGVSEARCGRGHVLDPSVAFQVSDCCGARLVRRHSHYGCSRCGRVVVSRFLFDERVFDGAYFAERARESRERKRSKVEELRRLLAGTRSGSLSLGEVPELDVVPGLVADLDAFVGRFYSGAVVRVSCLGSGMTCTHTGRQYQNL